MAKDLAKAYQDKPRGSVDLDLWQRKALFTGVDEVGRGCLAGPVVVAAAVLNPERVKLASAVDLKLLRDSKTLSMAQREKAYAWIAGELSLDFQVAFSGPRVIESVGIVSATFCAMRQAVSKLVRQPDLVLVDGRQEIADLQIPQWTMVKGDNLSWSIAAASILAKVSRDRWMMQAESSFPGYGFAKHVGYGTLQHRRALEQMGPCALHRRNFAPVKQMLAREI